MFSLSEPTSSLPAPTTSSSNASGIEPRPEDVLLGRGRSYDRSPGNALYHRIIQMHKEAYNCTRSRYKKAKVARKVIRLVQERGRFLSKDSQTGEWQEISEEVAHTKVAQALRYQGRRAAAVEETRAVVGEPVEPMDYKSCEAPSSKSFEANYSVQSLETLKFLDSVNPAWNTPVPNFDFSVASAKATLPPMAAPTNPLMGSSFDVVKSQQLTSSASLVDLCVPRSHYVPPPLEEDERSFDDLVDHVLRMVNEV